MKGTKRCVRSLAAVALLQLAGCVYTTAGTKLPPLTPPAPSFKPSVQYTVGDYEFRLVGGAMISGTQAGKLVNAAIMEAWKEKGYVQYATEVDDGRFTNTVDYNVTLSGTQYGESSIFLQIVSGLTLTLLPYTVTQNYDLQYTIEEVRSGNKYSGSAQDSNTAYIELFLLLALPWGQRGQEQLMATMGDHLYSQLTEQGAFRSAPVAAAPAPATPPPGDSTQ
jgi:hypothetical protein